MGMAARHREARRYVGVAADAVDWRSVAGACRFRVVEAGGGFARLRCGSSWLLAGEKIEVHAAEVDGGLVVDVVSVCAWPTKFQDWGKNAKNVRRFFEALDKQVTPSEAERVPCCLQCGYLLAGIDGSKCPECGLAEGETAKGPSEFVRKARLVLIVGLVMIGAEVLLLIGLQALGVGVGRLAGTRGVVMIVTLNVVLMTVAVILARTLKLNR